MRPVRAGDIGKERPGTIEVVPDAAPVEEPSPAPVEEPVPA